MSDRIKGLGELASNLCWSWRPRARMLFKMLSRQAWKKSGHNPDKMFREMPTYRNGVSNLKGSYYIRMKAKHSGHRSLVHELENEN